MKKVSISLLLVVSISVSADAWKWNTKVNSVKSFSNSNIICFSAEGIDRSYICFDSSQPGGSERFSVLLAAKMADISVDISYRQPETGETILWLDDADFYWSHHLYIR